MPSTPNFAMSSSVRVQPPDPWIDVKRWGKVNVDGGIGVHSDSFVEGARQFDERLVFGDEARDLVVELFISKAIRPHLGSARKRFDNLLAAADSSLFSKEVVLAGRTVPANDPSILKDLVSACREYIVGAR